MRLLAISHLFPNSAEPRYGIFAARQLSEMARLGAEIVTVVPRVWCPSFLRRFERWRDQDHSSPLCAVEGLETISIPYVRPPGNWYNRWSGLATFHTIKKTASELHAARRFDIIYATDFFPDGDAGVRLSRYLGIPVACLGIGVDVNITAHISGRMYEHFKRTARSLDGALACGRMVADGIKAVTEREPLCVYGVLDLEEFSPPSDRTALRDELKLPDCPVLLYAGYLARRKGAYELIEAFSRIRRRFPDALLVMCGGGSEKTQLRSMADELGIGAGLIMNGEVPPKQMNKWMKASDMLVLPSYTEGMPNVVMEAMACGLPVVATAVGGLPDAVGDCPGAILIPPRDVSALEDAITAVLGDGETRRRMGIAARERAQEKFGVTRNARRILDYLQSIIDSRSESNN